MVQLSLGISSSEEQEQGIEVKETIEITHDIFSWIVLN